MASGKDIEIKEKLVEVLKVHPEGLTIEELSTEIGAHRQTITKYMLELKGGGIIVRRRLGSATLHYLEERFLQRVSERKTLMELQKTLGKTTDE